MTTDQTSKTLPGEQWHAHKYPDCKTWTVTDERGTVASHIKTEAGARLIAAAPELLDALENLVEAIWDGGLEANGAEYYTDPARAALSKAKGQP